MRDALRRNKFIELLYDLDYFFYNNYPIILLRKQVDFEKSS